MKIEEALQRADTFGPLQSSPEDGDALALMTLAAEVRKLRATGNQVIESFEALGRTRDAATLLFVRQRCEHAMLGLKTALAFIEPAHAPSKEAELISR
jgi:hypothetical protein